MKGMNMKYFGVEQSAKVEITLTRNFLLEVPDDCTQDEAEKRLQELEWDVFFEQQVEWINDGPCEWEEVDAQGTTLTPESSAQDARGRPIITLRNKI
jgi:hypothetical protein